MFSAFQIKEHNFFSSPSTVTTQRLLQLFLRLLNGLTDTGKNLVFINPKELFVQSTDY